MQYEIKGEPLPVVVCQMESGESINCESGAMSWMTPNMEMKTSGGGVGKMFGKMLSGENLFQNTYTAIANMMTIHLTHSETAQSICVMPIVFLINTIRVSM